MIFGIDVASVDGNAVVNWSLAKSKGALSFAIPRATYGSYVDPYFRSTWANLQKLNILSGAYLFLRFPYRGVLPDKPEDQVSAFIKAVGLLHNSLCFPPCLDIEFPGRGMRDTGLTIAQAMDWIQRAWHGLANAYGTPPIIYTSARVWAEDLKNISADELTESPLWLARYAYQARVQAQLNISLPDPPVPVPWGQDNWWIHQYQGDAINYPGFPKTVDLNRFNPLLFGEKSLRVSWVQRKLNLLDDGNFGAVTLGTLKDFQKSEGLLVDGVIGPRTFAELCWVG